MKETNMFATLRRSWPVLIGFLLFLFSTHKAAAVLQEAPDKLPVQAGVPSIIQTSSPADDPVIFNEQPFAEQPSEPVEEPVISPDRPASLGPAAHGADDSREQPSSEQDLQVVEPTGPPISPGPPTRLVIPALGLDAPIVPAETKTVSIAGQEYQQWKAPDRYAAGWHTGSAELGQLGNTVLNGHHNIKGEVFKRLEELSPGDQILVSSFEGVFTYEIANKMILPEKYEQLDTRMNNAQWLFPSQDERLTLITCWPYESNTHRLIIVARPVHRERIVRLVE